MNDLVVQLDQVIYLHLSVSLEQDARVPFTHAHLAKT